MSLSLKKVAKLKFKIYMVNGGLSLINSGSGWLIFWSGFQENVWK